MPNDSSHPCEGIAVYTGAVRNMSAECRSIDISFDLVTNVPSEGMIGVDIGMLPDTEIVVISAATIGVDFVNKSGYAVEVVPS